MSKWIQGWQTIRGLASSADQARLLAGKPIYLGYITSAFKVRAGRNAADPHADWETKIAPRVTNRVIKELAAVDPALTPFSGFNKVGGVKHFHSLAPQAQKFGLSIGDLRGHVNSGHYAQVDEARAEFSALAREISKRAGV